MYIYVYLRIFMTPWGRAWTMGPMGPGLDHVTHGTGPGQWDPMGPGLDHVIKSVLLASIPSGGKKSPQMYYFE